ncbi:MAG: radical SAM protein [Candidatus Lokiarchaeota archaeon]|nr:radical SAM protein [Candidatus Lokiarchaeota archaeon]
MIEIPEYFESMFKVISLHFTSKCNLNCPFCYRSHDGLKEKKPREFFLDLIPYIKRFAPQIALGGGEPLTDPEFLIKMGEKCTQEGLLFNFTTNGHVFSHFSNKQIKQILEHVTMLSVSFDYYKWGKNTTKYAELIHRLKNVMSRDNTVENETRIQTPLIGANLLIDGGMFKDGGITFLNVVRWLIHTANIDRVYALYPKFTELIDIIPYKPLFTYLTEKYPFFYVDELIRKAFEEEGFEKWKEPCHFGKDMININETGEVTGCSFESTPSLIMKHPCDLLRIENITFKERYRCPFIPHIIKVFHKVDRI